MVKGREIEGERRRRGRRERGGSREIDDKNVKNGDESQCTRNAHVALLILDAVSGLAAGTRRDINK